MAQRALNETPRKRQIAIMRGAENYVIVESIAESVCSRIDAQGNVIPMDARVIKETVFKTCADVALVLAVVRHRNPDASVFFVDDERDVIRIH